MGCALVRVGAGAVASFANGAAGLAGATVHFVTAELDHGPVVIQGAVAVADDDTADSLAAKVLRVEHRIYPQAVRWWVEGRLQIDGLRVRVDGGQGHGELLSPQ